MSKMGRERSPEKRNAYRIAVIAASAGLLLLLVLFSIGIGTAHFTLQDVQETVRGIGSNRAVETILFNVRIPRILTGVAVGINLSVAGVLLQAMLRTPMASPNVIGVNAGAGLAAVMIMALFPGAIVVVPVAALLGALSAAVLIYIFSELPGSGRTIQLVLAGVAISSLLRAVTSALMMLFSDVLEISYAWQQGSLSGRGWTEFRMILPYTVAGVLAAVLISPKLNLFALGAEMAKSVGMRIRLYRFLVMLIASVLSGSAISAAGTIGFVGLISPHCARALIGGDNRYLVPLSAVFGAILMVLSDTVARTAFQPVEISVGIVTAVLGAPFFLFLLFRTGGKRMPD